MNFPLPDCNFKTFFKNKSFSLLTLLCTANYIVRKQKEDAENAFTVETGNDLFLSSQYV